MWRTDLVLWLVNLMRCDRQHLSLHGGEPSPHSRGGRLSRCPPFQALLVLHLMTASTQAGRVGWVQAHASTCATAAYHARSRFPGAHDPRHACVDAARIEDRHAEIRDRAKELTLERLRVCHPIP